MKTDFMSPSGQKYIKQKLACGKVKGKIYIYKDVNIISVKSEAMLNQLMMRCVQELRTSS